MIKPKIVRYKSVESTNDEAKKSALENAVFIAQEQTKGRGSKGRSWQSPQGGGLYMSFLVRPKIEPEVLPGLTLMAAVVVCEAIEKSADVKAQIKWPNDVLTGGKKIAGILTETVFDSKEAQRAVCGIGINTNQTFSGELKKKAASLNINDNNRIDTLCDNIIIGFFCGYELFLKEGIKPFLHEFRRRSAVSGTVKIMLPSETLTGRFVGFDDTGAIIIEIDGESRRFIAGEISLRGEDGYV